jgi:DUF1009 family protein
MCPCEKGQLGPSQTAGLIAGRGALPRLLISAWKAQGITPVIIGLDGITDPELLKNEIHLMTPIGKAGAIFDFLKAHNVGDIVLLGAMNRPAWTSVRPDKRGISIFLKLLACWMKGDNALLSAVRREIESEGFRIKGVQEYMPELLVPEGVLTKAVPLPEDEVTIQIGIDVAKIHGLADLGQSVVVQHGEILDVEGKDGTDALIARAGEKKAKGRGPVLVKLCKPQQDRALDMPTIGTKTVQMAADAGFSGIVAEAGATLLPDREAAVRLCDEFGIFLKGVLPK